MSIMNWVRSIKPDLVKLQKDTGIPAIWAASVFCHESAGDGPRGLSELAEHAHNYGGLKFAPWQTRYGCTPVTYGTWEEIDGQRVDLADAFCRCPSWEVWLQVYAALLTGDPYRAALIYADDPLLYGSLVATRWATDSRYIAKAADWMRRLYPEYRDTLPDRVEILPPPERIVPVVLPTGATITGYIRKGTTYVRLGDVAVPVRHWAEKLGAVVTWIPPEQGGPRVEITLP